MSLAADPEYPSDKYLLHIVQLQGISNKIAASSASNFPSPHATNSEIEHSYDELKAELSLYRGNLPFP
jgi:hypothetical protein